MQTTLYLMVGYPGAGKTTVAKLLAEVIHGEHLWADYERDTMFGKPGLNESELTQLYLALNDRVGQLLRNGTSVVFDTNFRYRRDRDLLRAIAAQAGAVTSVVWVTTDKQTAYQRATTLDTTNPTRVWGAMATSTFERLTNAIEKPDNSEHVITIPGLNVTKEIVAKALSRQLA